MPLEKAPVGSPGFGRNIKTEMEAGKPQKQAIAIAYKESGEKQGKDCMATGKDAMNPMAGGVAAPQPSMVTAPNAGAPVRKPAPAPGPDAAPPPMAQKPMVPPPMAARPPMGPPLAPPKPPMPMAPRPAMGAPRPTPLASAPRPPAPPMAAAHPVPSVAGPQPAPVAAPSAKPPMPVWPGRVV